MHAKSQFYESFDFEITYLTEIITDNNSVGIFTRKLINDRRFKTNIPAP